LQRPAAGLEVKLGGDVLIGDLSVVTIPEGTQVATANNTEDLLAWQALAMKGLKFTMAPAVRPRLEVDDVAITDLNTKLIITEQGKLNLQTVAQRQAAAGGASAPGATAGKASAPSAAPATARAASASSPTEAAPLPIEVRVGAVRLINGRIDFTDLFIRPNYSAVMTEMNGQVGSFSSGSRELADVALRGRVAGTGLLDIAGKLNPTIKPVALDIKAKATDLELAPLSAYSGKYAGYAIERGKLSVNVAYKIDPDGKLEANNQIILNQLTFGEKVESKDATKLPVLFAVALLKDRNGVIDVNVPISGTVNDPKFSVGGIIWQVIVNLITKAVTAPFSLLTGGAGGNEQNQVEFVPGTTVMAPAGAETIDKVAKALADRPNLKMTVTGTADPVRESEAYQAATIDAKLLAEQRRENLRAGVPADAASAAPATLTTEERTRQLTRLYKATDVPGKPRNAIGFAKDIPAAEMEALLRPQMPVTDEAMRELALQRGLAVRDGLVAKGLPSDRLFLAAPKLAASAAAAAASAASAAPGDAGAAWAPRSELSLSAK
jgi:outer membrane protein OmpA-like peptidoglycan-associated protein